MMNRKKILLSLILPCLLAAGLLLPACAATDSNTARSTADRSSGASLWLNYHELAPARQNEWSARVRQVFCLGTRAILLNARDELQQAAGQLTGRQIAVTDSPAGKGTVLLGRLDQLDDFLPRPAVLRAIALAEGGYLIERIRIDGKFATAIVSRDDAGVLYGVFHLVRWMQTGEAPSRLSLSSEPAITLRMLNHWDNLNGSIERGYGGKSLWKWEELPEQRSPRYEQYARYCASIGINAVVLNNVNANPRILREDYLKKVEILAGIFREWGIQTYLSVSFASPIRPEGKVKDRPRWRGVGDLVSADPLDPEVRQWWQAKVDEIYTLIPNFGGFLVKADSEGQPGPASYGRTHVDGANMLADALAPHGGTLIWRAFVYDNKGDDRAKEAYEEFKPFDGDFRDNVFIQVKNGPLDFQPREPFAPLFGGMPKTKLSLELQIAKEYLGHATTFAYLGPLWTEVLRADTFAEGEGSTLAKVIDGSLHGKERSCIAGVANTGDGDEWCGSIFNQANWYAFGRLAWDPRLGAEEIAKEWIRMTIPADAPARATILEMMMGSHEAVVNYSTPLGLNFLCKYQGHYDPSPATRSYFHRADADGIGFDRTDEGSNYTAQYHPELQAIFNDPDKTPLKYLLWFHHVSWDEPLRTGRTLWEELVHRYNLGVASVDQMADTWESLEGRVPPTIHASVMAKLNEEKSFARQWRDTCLQYFSGYLDD
ncbi:MAG: alpha-glucuronidase family glycosyl hydrolase [Opitutales bacterium]